MRRLLALAVLLALPAAALAEGPNLGRPASKAEIARADIDIGADGAGLPPGSGTVRQGAAVYETHCQACHGPAGVGGSMDRLTGGLGTIARPDRIKTVASYWPYAPTLFDYVRRAMPLNAPRSLTDDEVYAVTAYLLSVDGIVAKDARLDAKSLSKVRMPNRDGFVRTEQAPR